MFGDMRVGSTRVENNLQFFTRSRCDVSFNLSTKGYFMLPVTMQLKDTPVQAVFRPKNYQDRSGEVVGTVKVLERYGTDMKGVAVWKCCCDCKEVFAVSSTALNMVVKGIQLTVCPICRAEVVKEHRLEAKRQRRVSKKRVEGVYGNYTIVPYIQGTGSDYAVRCDCGYEHVVSLGHLNAVKKQAEVTGEKQHCKSCGSSVHILNAEKPPSSLLYRYYLRYRLTAKKHKRAFNLTLEEFTELAHSPCHYCGVETDVKHVSKNKVTVAINAMGVDRVDSGGGYELENCVPCCFHCNRMKLDRSEGEWLAKVKRVYEHLKLGG
jgi:hypothetical protein